MSQEKDQPQTILCSGCFTDEGLRLSADYIGTVDPSPCPNCGLVETKKLDRDAAERLVHQFYTWGSFRRFSFGGAPQIVSNNQRQTEIVFAKWSGEDAKLLAEKLQLGFFFYGPRFWMVGEIEPLKALQDQDQRTAIIERILTEYPEVSLNPGESFYRVRRAPSSPTNFQEYDSPPDNALCDGRLESKSLPILYGSKDLETCIHECRLTVQDEAFVATLNPRRTLRLLDLTHLLREENVTEFESLDLAVHMLFLAEGHSYPISRELSKCAYERDFDGVVYPSFFSLARTGAMPFPTVLGTSVRRIPKFAPLIQSQTIPNIALSTAR